MKIRMLETRIATQDAHNVHQYQKGEVYVVSQWLARQFFKEKVAVLVNDKIGKIYPVQSNNVDF